VIGLSIRHLLRGGIAPALIALTAAFALAPAAQAASAATHTSGLHTSGKAVKLGKASAIEAVAESPDGDIAYAIGKNVYYVSGTSKPVFLISASSKIIALAATNTALFVQTGLTVSEYTADIVVRRWTLSSPVRPITSAGLLVVGHTVWSWTDWATDESGFEYATVSEFSTSSSKVRQISKNEAYPAAMAAGSAGLYYGAITASGTSYLVLTSPSGATKHRVKTAIEDYGSVALSAGRVDVLAMHANGDWYVDSFRASTLARLDSKRIPAAGGDLAGTAAGLLLLTCETPSCGKASVGVFNPATGSVRNSVTVPHAYTLLPGPAPAALTDVSGNTYLVRLALRP
jgi:hypothetical protein